MIGELYMDFNKFKNICMEWVDAYTKFDKEAFFSVKDKASEEEIALLEKDLSAEIPKSLKDFFAKNSKSVEMRMFLSDDIELPEGLQEIFSACFLIDLDEVLEAETSRRSWAAECFNNINDKYDKVWHNKFGIMTVANGDVIALDISVDRDNPPVVYLSHDDGEGHGAIIGKTFDDFLMNLASIGGVGNEDWQFLPFIDNMKDGLNPNCENAIKYRHLIMENV